MGRFKKVGFDFLAGDVGPGHGVHIHTRTRTWANCVISTDCRLAGVPQPLDLLKIAESKKKKKNLLAIDAAYLQGAHSTHNFFFPISKLLKFLFVIDTQQGETFRIITYMRSTCTDGYTEVYIPVWRCLVYNWANFQGYGSPGEPGGGGLGG